MISPNGPSIHMGMHVGIIPEQSIFSPECKNSLWISHHVLNQSRPNDTYQLTYIQRTCEAIATITCANLVYFIITYSIIQRLFEASRYGLYQKFEQQASIIWCHQATNALNQIMGTPEGGRHHILPVQGPTDRAIDIYTRHTPHRLHRGVILRCQGTGIF